VWALLIGVYQAFIILLGISHAGSTIAAARYARGRSEAVRFSFSLALPVILGATVVERKELLQTGIPLQ
jgi:undecaprenyl-diphosphatase